MVLAIDIGNTHIVLGCVEGEKIIFRERMSTNPNATRLEVASMIKTAFDMYRVDYTQIKGAIISSVVPSVTKNVKGAIEKFAKIKTLVVEPGIKTGISIKIDNPAQLGSDLLVSAVAIHSFLSSSDTSHILRTVSSTLALILAISSDTGLFMS